MSHPSSVVFYGSILLAGSGPALAETVDEKVPRLERLLNSQQAQLEAQEQTIGRQRAALGDQHHGLDLLRHQVMMESRGRGSDSARRSSDRPLLLAQAEDGSAPETVGQKPDKPELSKPEVGALADIGGVLTPRGRLVIEPSLQYSHSSVNRVTFRGVEILSSLAIGALDVVDADRDSLVASVTGRLGVTNRLELEFKVPYVWRDDEERATIPDIDPEISIDRNLDGDGIGDLEFAAHYQLNGGQGGWPFFIANGRLKLTNGEGPFDIDRDSDGIGQELAVGSGFYSFEPSITALFPSAPAVFFGNLGYLYNIEDDVDKTIGEDQFISKVDPGDAVRLSFGMAYSINERASFTVGFKNDWIDSTDTTINGQTLSGSKLNIGSMLLGYSYQLTPKTGINLNVEFGITEDATDMVMTLRVPFTTDPLWL